MSAVATALAHRLHRLPATIDEAAARGSLRAQIARLEADLVAIEVALPPPNGIGDGGRLLSFAELEVVRDRLLSELRVRQLAAAAPAERQEQMRRLREEALADPASHRFALISNADCGDHGCVALHVRPRFGILGMLMNWWRVRISSGCP
jgi:hypothetical protein